MTVYIVVGAFILIDVITGILKALYFHELNSTNLRKGLYHKLSEIIAVICCGLLEYGVKVLQGGTVVPILNIVPAYICVMETISILENVGEINPKLTKLINHYLEKLKGRDDDGEEGN